MSTTGKCIEIESRLVVTKGWGRKEWGLTANGCGIAFRGNENVQKLDSAFLTSTLPVHKSLCIYQNHWVEHFIKVNFMVCECNKET